MSTDKEKCQIADSDGRLVVLMVVNSVEEVSFQLALEADGQFHGIEV